MLVFDFIFISLLFPLFLLLFTFSFIYIKKNPHLSCPKSNHLLQPPSIASFPSPLSLATAARLCPPVRPCKTILAPLLLAHLRAAPTIPRCQRLLHTAVTLFLIPSLRIRRWTCRVPLPAAVRGHHSRALRRLILTCTLPTSQCRCLLTEPSASAVIAPHTRVSVLSLRTPAAPHRSKCHCFVLLCLYDLPACLFFFF